MSERHPLAKLALRELADAPAPVDPPTTNEADDAVAAIARELDAVRSRKKKRMAALVALAVAAAIGLFVGASSFVHSSSAVVVAPVASTAPVTPVEMDPATVDDVSGSVLVVRGEHAAAVLARGETVAKGDRIVASALSSATVKLRRGTEVRAGAGADVLVAEHGATEIFELRAGSVELHVAKLLDGERLLVRTNDADVEVRGTEFRVDVTEPCNGTTTRVSVTEGVVSVRHAGVEKRINAGQAWPEPCERIAAPATTTSARTVARPSPAPMASSDLAEQNGLFADALAAKKRGDTAGALSALERLNASYPNGPLAESASVERMRILAANDPAKGADAARAYLARHPKGYAREEARKIAGGS